MTMSPHAIEGRKGQGAVMPAPGRVTTGGRHGFEFHPSASPFGRWRQLDPLRVAGRESVVLPSDRAALFKDPGTNAASSRTISGRQPSLDFGRGLFLQRSCGDALLKFSACGNGLAAKAARESADVCPRRWLPHATHGGEVDEQARANCWQGVAGGYSRSAGTGLAARAA